MKKGEGVVKAMVTASRKLAGEEGRKKEVR